MRRGPVWIGWGKSLGIVGLVAKNRLGGYVSALTRAILYFFRRRSRGERAARQAVLGMPRGFRIVSLDGDAVDAAYPISRETNGRGRPGVIGCKIVLDFRGPFSRANNPSESREIAWHLPPGHPA